MSIAYSKSVSKKPTVRVYLGQDLAREARKGTPTERALLAADAVGADVWVLTPSQATALTKANLTYVAKLRRMIELERAAVKAGRIKLSGCVNHHKPVNDTDLDSLLAEVGADRWFATVDRATTPLSVAA